MEPPLRSSVRELQRGLRDELPQWIRDAFKDLDREIRPVIAERREEMRSGLVTAASSIAVARGIDIVRRWRDGTNVDVDLSPRMRREVAQVGNRMERFTASQLNRSGIVALPTDAARQARDEQVFKLTGSLRGRRESYRGQFAQLAEETLIKGQTAAQWRERAIVLERQGDRASRLIARDIVGDVTAAVETQMFAENGIERFTWTTQGDRRVRPTHRELNGRTFRVDTGGPGGIRPGSEVMCRCFSVPVR